MNREINTKIVTFIFLLVVVVLLIFLGKVGFLNQIKSYPVYLISSIGKTFQSPSNKASDLFWTLESIARFKEENAELKKKNLEIEYRISELKEIQRENEILKKQIKFSESSCSNGNCIEWKMANIIGRDPSNFGKHVLIDLGKNDSVAEGQPITATGGLLIGKVIEVFDNSSKVILITDGKSSINSITQTSRANGVVKGSYATGVRLEMINQSEELIIDDLIITSGLEDRIPKGLIIGKVSSIKESANNVFKSAEINMLVNINKIEKVFIVIKD